MPEELKMTAEIANGRLILVIPLNATPRECAKSFAVADARWVKTGCQVDGKNVTVNLVAIIDK